MHCSQNFLFLLWTSEIEGEEKCITYCLLLQRLGGDVVWMMGENALKGMHASSNQITQKCRRLGTKRRLVTWAEIFAEQIFQDWISAWSAPENKISGMFVSLDPCHRLLKPQSPV